MGFYFMRRLTCAVQKTHFKTGLLPAAYLFRPWLIYYGAPCCFQEGRVRVTLLARSTEYRRILNQVEVSEAPPSLLLSVPQLSCSSSFSSFLSLFFSSPSVSPFLSTQLSHALSPSVPPLIYCSHLLSAYLKSYLP